MSEVLYKEGCPSCPSSDAFAVYDDGHGWCFSCGHRVAAVADGGPPSTPRASVRKTVKDLIQPGEALPIPARNLTKETCSLWGYTVGEMGGKAVQIAAYKDTSGHTVAQKVRFATKEFVFIGSTKDAGLFGQHLWRDGGKKVVITEGEIDAMSVSQVQGHKWPVVSIPTGVKGAAKALRGAYEWLTGFDEIILMFDDDEPGRDAVEECALILPPGKAKVARIRGHKDANAALKAGAEREIVDAIWGAKVFRPDGIVAGSDLWDKVMEETDAPAIPLPYRALQEMTLGIRGGELWTFTAGSGIGKSAVIRELQYSMIQQGHTVGAIMLEEDVRRTGRALMGLAANRLVQKQWHEMTDDEKVAAFDATLGTGRVFLYDHFGSTDIDNVVGKVRYMAVGCGCNVVFLDHISIVVSGEESGDERRLIDNLMTALKTVAMETGVAVVVVSHLKRPSGDKGHEEGHRTSLAHLRGSHAIAQLSDFVIGMERDQQGKHKHVTTLRVLKNRWTGETGEAGWLEYSTETGRLVELSADPFAEEPAGFIDHNPPF